MNTLKKSYSLIDSSVKKRLPVLFLSNVFISILEVVGVSLIFPIFSLFVNPDLVHTSPIYFKVYSMLPISNPNHFTILICFAMIFLIVFKNVASIFVSRWQYYFMNKSCGDLSSSYFQQYLLMKYTSFLKRNTSLVTYVSNSSPGVLFSNYLIIFVQNIGDVITVFLFLSAVFVVDFRIALLMFLSVTVTGGGVYYVTKEKLRLIGQRSRHINEKLLRYVKEAFSSFKALKISCKEDVFIKKYVKNRQELGRISSQQMTLVMINRHLMEILLLVGICVVAGVAFFSNEIAVALGKLSLFGLVAVRLIPIFSRLLSGFQTMKTAEETIDMMCSEKKDLDNSIVSNNLSNDFKPNISFCSPVLSLSKVCFSYNNQGKQKTISNVNLEIPFRQSIGFVGKSGAGKTTLVDLILGILAPDEGNITVNGYDIKLFETQWRKELGYVPQDIAIIEASLRENVAFGVDSTEIDDDRIKEVIKLSQLEQFIADLPEGVNSYLGEDGKKISGGQKQRIGIARALYHRPSFLVLDEATSALDLDTEKKVIQCVHALTKECTVIIVAHRLSAVKDCDKIVFMDQGTIESVDSFQNLAKGNSEFRNLIKSANIR